MLATLAEPPLTGKGLVFEPKYDGIRALVHVAPGAARPTSGSGRASATRRPRSSPPWSGRSSRSRAGCVRRCSSTARSSRSTREGRPAGFQRLQGRIHLKGAHDIDALDRAQPAAFIAFDLLRDGAGRCARAAADGAARAARGTSRAAASQTRSASANRSPATAAPSTTRARQEGWEGLIVKEASSPYQSGRRSPAWRKLKLVNEQEFVVGGWTEPRNTRSRFGALLLGVYDDQQPGRPLIYVGHTGTGFDQKELERVWKLLGPREIRESPFAGPIKTNEPAHWVRPELVAQVRFTEWTADRKLRHPVYLGLRDDKPAAEVTLPGGRPAARAGRDEATAPPKAARSAPTQPPPGSQPASLTGRR